MSGRISDFLNRFNKCRHGNRRGSNQQTQINKLKAQTVCSVSNYASQSMECILFLNNIFNIYVSMY